MKGRAVKLQAGRVAIVTGAASGIGAALARKAGQAGMKLVLADINGDRLAEFGRELADDNLSVDALVGDISDLDFVRQVADAAFARGSVQLICSNAGIVVPGRSWEISIEDWERVLRINFLATVYLLQAGLPRMIESGETGHVLITGSMASVTARPGIAPYVSAKHGLLGLAESTFHELRAANIPIGVTLLMPGQVITGMMTGAAPPPTAITAERVAELALAGVQADQLFTFTQADRIPEVSARFAAITAGQWPQSPA
jgi:NAD(P)-dependent dehydrogenase (short-subunit alcohol dehydrogenase family)